MKDAKNLAIIMFLTLITVVFVCFSNARADYAQSRFNYTWDSDKTTTSEFLLGYAVDFNKWTIGAMQGIKTVKDPDGDTSFNETVITFEGKPYEFFEVSGSAGVAYKSSFNEFIADFLVVYDPKISLKYPVNVAGAITN